jgi:hypothetical protein
MPSLGRVSGGGIFNDIPIVKCWGNHVASYPLTSTISMAWDFPRTPLSKADSSSVSKFDFNPHLGRPRASVSNVMATSTAEAAAQTVENGAPSSTIHTYEPDSSPTKRARRSSQAHLFPHEDDLPTTGLYLICEEQIFSILGWYRKRD